MSWRNILPYVFTTEPDPLRNFWPPRRRLWKLTPVAAAILVLQPAFALLAYGVGRTWPRLDYLPYDVVGFYGGLLIAGVLQFLLLRRDFHWAIAGIFAFMLACLGSVLAVVAIVARYGE